MGMLSGIMGDASKIDVADVEKDFAPMLVAGETLSAAFKLVRDLLVFTDRRLILVDKQGVSGKKTEYMSVPYRHIVRFATETAGGMLDHDAELRIWVMGSPGRASKYVVLKGKCRTSRISPRPLWFETTMCRTR